MSEESRPAGSTDGGATAGPSQPSAAQRAVRGSGAGSSSSKDDVPVLPERSAEDRDEGWGGASGDSGDRDDSWYEQERPPHWG